MPICSNADHRASSPRAPRNVRPGLVIVEIGYAVNQTEAFSTAARGSGLANGFCHMLPRPENWVANDVASASIDCSFSHSTYSGLPPWARPFGPPTSRGDRRIRARGPQRAAGRGIALLVVADLTGFVRRGGRAHTTSISTLISISCMRRLGKQSQTSLTLVPLGPGVSS